MKLKTYRKQKGLTLEGMAALVSEKLGETIGFHMLSRIERGQMPRPEVARAIYAATEQQVTPFDFFGFQPADAPAALSEGRAA